MHLDTNDFDRNLNNAFSSAHYQILKFESRQEYAEGEEFDDTLRREGVAGAIKLIEPIVEETIHQFDEFERKGLRFIRCRPIAFPPSDYISVQIEVYNRTIHPAAQTIWLNAKSAEEFIKEFADHDFMVFDARLALVYEHDMDGVFVGGWMFDSPKTISEFLALFAFLAAQSLPLAKLSDK